MRDIKAALWRLFQVACFIAAIAAIVGGVAKCSPEPDVRSRISPPMVQVTAIDEDGTRVRTFTLPQPRVRRHMTDPGFTVYRTSGDFVWHGAYEYRTLH